VVYPDQLPQSRWFEHYATLFDTVELNNTFYRLPTSAAVERWAAAAPKGFVYATKLGMFGSHRKKLREPEPWLANHLDRVERLGSALGPNLVSSRRDGVGTRPGSTNSSRPRRHRSAGQSSSVSRPGYTTMSSSFCNVTGRRCVSTI